MTTGILLAGCTGEPASPASPSPSASSAAPTSTPTPGAAAEAEEALLPMPVEDIADWAKTAVPGSDAEGFAAGLSGWLGEKSSARQTSTLKSLAPGAYQAQIACRGEGVITVTTGEVDGEDASEPITCANETIAFDATTTATGMQVRVELEGAPSIFAFSLVRVS